MLSGLTHIDLTHFSVIFLLKFLQNFIIQYWVRHDRLRIKLMRLSQSHDQNREFGKLIRVKSDFFYEIFSIS
jgi:hypothetical protein